MPSYEFRCVVCGEVFEEVFSMQEEHVAKHCGKPANRKFSPPREGSKEFVAGYDLGLGHYFNTQRERDRYAAEHGWRRLR